MTGNIFSKQITLLSKALDLRSKRNNLIASNIANRETPGYRAQDLVFEKELNNALHSDRPGPLRVSDPRHFDGIKREPLELVQGSQINSFNPEPKMDGNTVNLDKEMSKLAENQLMYNAMAQIIGRKLQSLKYAISEGVK